MNTSLSLTGRVSLMVAAAAAGVLLVAGILFEHAAENHFLEDDVQELNGKLELIQGLLATTTTPNAVTQLQSRIRDAMFGHPGIGISIATNDGTVLFSTGPDHVVKHLLEGAKLGITQPVIWSYGSRFYRIAANHLPIGIPESTPVNVAIALDITDDRIFMSEFRESLWFGMALAAVIMALLGWAAVYRGLLPLRQISALVASISAEQLNQVLPEDRVPVELRGLVLAFNRMLARLEDSFRRLSEFSADIAHELRTPIHNMLIQTQVTLSRERDATEYRANLQSILEEMERLSRMVTDMLFLARADNRLIMLGRESVDLDREVEQLLAFYEAYANDCGVALAQSGTARITGDRLMIQRALSNLLSNAIRFTSAGKVVSVAISEDRDLARVTVTNPGPEIATEHLSRIFERLYRVDPSRREGKAEHAGLGLAISKSIVEMHGGSIRAESSAGVTSFTITLPLDLPAQSTSFPGPTPAG